MEEINGVSFKDYACASANIVAGMTEEKVCQVLGLEPAVWEATKDGWNNKMAELTDEDMAFYGSVFTNPKQGRFANVEGAAAGPEEILKKYPEWSDTIKMEQYMAAASNVGLEIDFEKEFDISLTEYTQLAMHWSNWYKEKVMGNEVTPDDIRNDTVSSEAQIEGHKVFTQQAELSEKWKNYYSEKYKDQNSELSDDISF